MFSKRFLVGNPFHFCCCCTLNKQGGHGRVFQLIYIYSMSPHADKENEFRL